LVVDGDELPQSSTVFWRHWTTDSNRGHVILPGQHDVREVRELAPHPVGSGIGAVEFSIDRQYGDPHGAKVDFGPRPRRPWPCTHRGRRRRFRGTGGGAVAKVFERG